MQWNRDPLPWLHDGRDFHRAEVDLPPSQTVKLRSSPGEQKGRDEDIVLWLALALFPARLRFRFAASRILRSVSRVKGLQRTDLARRGTPTARIRAYRSKWRESSVFLARSR